MYGGGAGVDPMNPAMTQMTMVGGGMNPMMSGGSAGSASGGYWSTQPPRTMYQSHRKKRKGLFHSIFGHDRYPGQGQSEATGLLSICGVHGHDDYHHGHRAYHERPPVGFFAPSYPAPLPHDPNQMMSSRFYDTGQPPLYWHEDSDSSSEEDCFAGIADDLDAHPLRIYLWITALVEIGFSLLLLVMSWLSMGREDFHTFSALTTESGYFSFWALLSILVTLALFSIILACLSFYVGWKESVPVLKALEIVDIILAVTLIVVVICTWAQSSLSTPDLFRSANVICQDINLWGCNHTAMATNNMSHVRVVDMGVGQGEADVASEDQTSESRRLLLEERRALLPGWGRRLFQSSFHDRRLMVSPMADVSSAVAAQNFMADHQRFPTQAVKCQFVAEMCMPPPNFNAATACVCNGVGVVVTTTTTTTIRTMTGATITRTSVTTHSSTLTTVRTTTTTTRTTTTSTLGGSALDDIPEGPATRRLGGVRADGVRNRADAPGASWTDRRLQQATITTTATTATTITTTATTATTITTTPPGQAAGGEDEASSTRTTRTTTTTISTGLFDVDGAQKAVGGWTGTAGAYCGAWDEGDPAWCYSNPGQQCDSGQVAASGGEYKKSTGPCGNAVESRSEYVLEGRSAVNAPLICAVLLALCLLAVAAGALIIPWKVHDTMLTTFSRDMQQHATRLDQAKDDLYEQFVQAQQKARQKVKKETSNDMRLALFGLYRQATEGDVRGQRPNFFSSENRAKYDYWAKHRGMSRREAMLKYIELVEVMVE